MKTRRRIILGLLLTVSIALSVQALIWAPDASNPAALPTIVQPVVRANAATLDGSGPHATVPDSGAGSGKSADSLQLASRPVRTRSVRDLFAAYSWAPPPPAAPTPAAEAPPEAPALLFVYIGRIEVDGKSTFLLLQGDRTRRVSIGESLDDFKLISSGPAGLVFQHPPTGLTRTLPAPGVPVASVPMASN